MDTTENYLIVLRFFLISTLFVILLFFLVKTVAPYFLQQKVSGFAKKNSKQEIKKKSSYECGFEPFHDSRTPFYVQYYITAMMFLLFDIELAMLLPWATNLRSADCLCVLNGFLFFAILLLGFFFELLKGALDWNKTDKWDLQG